MPDAGPAATRSDSIESWERVLDRAVERFADRLAARFGEELARTLGDARSANASGASGTVGEGPPGDPRQPAADGIAADVLERAGVRAFRWQGHGQHRYLRPIEQRDSIAPADLLGIGRQLAAVDANTRQFVHGLPRNNVLLWGARGTGKSSLVKAMLTRYGEAGLRLVEVDAHELVDLADVVAPLAGRRERYILFVDDLSFEAGDPSYRSLKAALDGSAAVTPENVAIYATSNRRHLMPEQAVDNEHSRLVDGELHHGEAVEEKISLSERFGLWLAFHPFSQALYLDVVAHWLDRQGLAGSDDGDAWRREALQWALRRGNRSGRVARQFALDYAGRRALAALEP